MNNATNAQRPKASTREARAVYNPHKNAIKAPLPLSIWKDDGTGETWQVMSSHTVLGRTVIARKTGKAGKGQAFDLLRWFENKTLVKIDELLACL
jgi:hypothetical protein